ncbi:hypothetical protein PIB30_105732, partial [Stylosanthes scabra]|nr:hypothetical protein [Stylosanthes scabra]
MRSMLISCLGAASLLQPLNEICSLTSGYSSSSRSMQHSAITFLFFTMELYNSSLKGDLNLWLSKTETEEDDAIVDVDEGGGGYLSCCAWGV